MNLNSQLNQHFTSISKTETMRLSDYLKGQMRMSHIYQPVMIWTLLDKGGNASIREIAREIAGYDEAMLEYYEERVKNMVGTNGNTG